MMPVLMISNGQHLLAALAPQAGGAPPAPWVLDYASARWTQSLPFILSRWAVAVRRSCEIALSEEPTSSITLEIVSIEKLFVRGIELVAVRAALAPDEPALA